MQSFRLLDTAPAPGAWNIATDAALMESVRAGGPPVLRFYRWSPACLSLGRNQPARDAYDTDALRQHGVDAVRRPTGGRAVLHDRELTYSVVARDGTLGSPRQAYAAINRALMAGLRRLGVPAALHGRTGGRAPAPSLAPCFAEPVEGEIVAAGRKLVGSAQGREGGVMLQHGSLLLDGDQAAIREFLRPLASGPAPEASFPATLADFCDPLPCWDALTRALAEGWVAALGGSLRPEPLTEAEHARAAEIAERRFLDPAWTWHR